MQLRKWGQHSMIPEPRELQTISSEIYGCGMLSRYSLDGARHTLKRQIDNPPSRYATKSTRDQGQGSILTVLQELRYISTDHDAGRSKRIKQAVVGVLDRRDRLEQAASRAQRLARPTHKDVTV
jgi:hypothetical protein